MKLSDLLFGVCFFMVVMAIVTVLILNATTARGAGLEESTPDMKLWYESLRQPDYPTTSCCGEGDAYFADDTEPCTDADELKVNALNAAPGNPYHCALVAIITDKRGDNYTDQQGRTRSRLHVEPGTRVVVTTSKIRRVPSENPTDHNVIFLGQSNWVYCWEPTAGI